MAAHDDLVHRTDALEQTRTLRESFLETHRTTKTPVERIDGRVIAENVVAETDQPAADHATMDGYAFATADDGPFKVVDEGVFPESNPPTLEANTAVRIATGAPLPERADTVVKREDTSFDGERLEKPDLDAGTYVYERGSNVSAGDRLYEAGDRLSALDAIMLRDLGREAVTVYEPFSVGVLATGTEIHEGRHTDLDSPMLCNLLRSWGHDPSYEGTVPDEGGRVEDRIADLADRHDVVVTTGGTSVGKKDYVLDALGALGEVAFHRVRVRPGKPIALARLPDHDAIAVAIPGKPIGAYVSATFVGRALFTGESATATLERTLATDIGLGPEGFEYVVPVVLEGGEALPLGHVDSPLEVYEDVFDPSVLSSSTRAATADGFVVTSEDLTAGARIEVVPTAALE